MAKVKLVRFKDNTNCGMVRYRAGELYPLGPGVKSWLDKSMGEGSYEIVDGPEEDAAAPETMRTPKVSSRTASSKKAAKAKGGAS